MHVGNGPLGLHQNEFDQKLSKSKQIIQEQTVSAVNILEELQCGFSRLYNFPLNIALDNKPQFHP